MQTMTLYQFLKQEEGTITIFVNIGLVGSQNIIYMRIYEYYLQHKKDTKKMSLYMDISIKYGYSVPYIRNIILQLRRDINF